MTNEITAGWFECSGISGVSMACGSVAMGIRLAYPHMSLGLFDGKDVLLSLTECQAAPDQSYARASWRVPVTPAGIKRFASFPRAAVNSPSICEYQPGESALITLEWQFTDGTVTGRYAADAPVRVGLFVNGCFRPAAVRKADAAGCKLVQADGKGQSQFRLDLALAGEIDSPFVIDSRHQAEQVVSGIEVPRGKSMAFYRVRLSSRRPLLFQMSLRAANDRRRQPKMNEHEIARNLEFGAMVYDSSRMRSAEALEGAAEAVADLAAYSRAYDPKRQRIQTTVNRTWAGPNSPGLVFGWDNFFTSYIAAWEDPALGGQSLEHAVSTYGERGATPEGIAAGPIQRNLIIPVMYCRTLDVLGDAALARRTWPTMMAFMRFWFADRGDGHPWRDGNRDGLIESGTSIDPRHATLSHLVQNAMDETGYDDIPIYSAGFTDGRKPMLADGVDFYFDSKTLTVTLVGQNSLYRASCLAMARWADRLGEAADAKWLRTEAERMGKRMKQRLLDDRRGRARGPAPTHFGRARGPAPTQAERAHRSAPTGIFRDRRWDGSFSPVKAMTIFYPLLAGIADDRVKKNLRRILLDPKQFWGDNLIPTVSRDDPAYCDGVDRAGNYWRGNCWPPATYIVYLAIKEAGWDDLAAEYAKRTVRQFMEYWNRHFHAYENYPPEGEVKHDYPYVSGWGGREVRYVWSAMMLFCGLEEIFAPEPLRPGLRFGNPHIDEALWHDFHFAGQLVEAYAGPNSTIVRFGTDWRFFARPGITVREFRRTEAGFRFRAIVPKPADVMISSTGMKAASVRMGGRSVKFGGGEHVLMFKLPKGTSEVVIG